MIPLPKYYFITMRMRQDTLRRLSAKCIVWKIRAVATAANLQASILTQRGGFLGRVKVRNLVLLMAVTLFQGTKPERTSFAHQQVPLSPTLDFVTMD